MSSSCLELFFPFFYLLLYDSLSEYSSWAQIFECSVSSWWHCLGGRNFCGWGLAVGNHHWWAYCISRLPAHPLICAGSWDCNLSDTCSGCLLSCLPQYCELSCGTVSPNLSILLQGAAGHGYMTTELLLTIFSLVSIRMLYILIVFMV